MIKKLVILIFVSLIFAGCASVKGPITGKTYPLFVEFYGPPPKNPFSYTYYQHAGDKYIKECKEYFFQQNPNLPEEIKQAIIKGNIHLGMTKDQITASWGTPEKINRTVTFSSAREQWVYPKRYLYFEDDVLISFQD